jgi:hypothetical protein
MTLSDNFIASLESIGTHGGAFGWDTWIPNGAIGILHRHNPSNHSMALGSTQPSEMCTRNISCGVKVASS